MTLSEAKDILVNRIGWRDDKTVKGFVLSAPNLLSNSGKFFQAEHTAITLENIRDCQPVRNIDAADFNSYLQDLGEQAVLQVLDDSFEKDFVQDNIFDLYPSAFDKAISLRMAIVVSELIFTSTRSNDIERLTKDFIGKLNYDIYRETVNKFANSKTYRYSMGISSRYGFEIDSVQARFGNQRNMLKTITAGANQNTIIPYFNDKHLNNFN